MLTSQEWSSGNDGSHSQLNTNALHKCSHTPSAAVVHLGAGTSAELSNVIQLRVAFWHEQCAGHQAERELLLAANSNLTLSANVVQQQ